MFRADVDVRCYIILYIIYYTIIHTYTIIIYYYIITIIISYTILFSSSVLFSPLLFFLSSLPFLSSDLLPLLFSYSPIPILISPSHLPLPSISWLKNPIFHHFHLPLLSALPIFSSQSSNNLILSFKVYVSAFGYPYLYSSSIQSFQTAIYEY